MRFKFASFSVNNQELAADKSKTDGVPEELARFYCSKCLKNLFSIVTCGRVLCTVFYLENISWKTSSRFWLLFSITSCQLQLQTNSDKSVGK